jgi:hypothetical protein
MRENNYRYTHDIPNNINETIRVFFIHILVEEDANINEIRNMFPLYYLPLEKKTIISDRILID